MFKKNIIDLLFNKSNIKSVLSDCNNIPKINIKKCLVIFAYGTIFFIVSCMVVLLGILILIINFWTN